jgi:glycosyl transferase family 25
MEKSKDRNNRFRSRLHNTQYKITRIDAVTPKTLNNQVILIPEKCKQLTESEMSCSISHLKAIHTAYNANVDYALIMEDDIFLVDSTTEIDWEYIIRSAPNDWEVLQLYTFDDNVYQTKDVKWVKHEPKKMTSTGAYLISRDGMKKILQFFIPSHYTGQKWEDVDTINLLDVLIECNADYFIYYHLKTYVHSEVLFNAEGIDSEIHADHLPAHIESIKKINAIREEKIKNSNLLEIKNFKVNN